MRFFISQPRSAQTARTAVTATALCIIVLLAAGTDSAEAAPITYTQTAIASGTLGVTTFTNALVTLTQTADTNNVLFSNNFYSVVPATSLFSVAGIGSGSFTSSTFTASQPSNGLAGLGSGTAGVGGPAVLSVINSAFLTYDLKTSIGPISATGVINPGLVLTTTAGNFSLSSVSGNATFQATLGAPAAVPEPSEWLAMGMAGTSVMGLMVRARRRKTSKSVATSTAA